MHQRVVHGHRRRRVVHDVTDIRGQAAGRGLLAGQRLYQVFFRSHRVAGRQPDHGDFGKSLGGSAHGVDGGGFVVLDGEQDSLDAERARHQPCSGQHLVTVLLHQAVIAGQVGFALGAIDDQSLQIVTLAQVELDGGGESRATHADDAGLGDPAGDLPRFQGERFGDRFDIVGPLVEAVGLQRDGAYRQAGRMMGRVAADTDDAPRGRCVHRGRDQALAARQQLALAYILAACHQGGCRRADVLL